MVNVVKKKFGYDDSYDAFGVHGIGGIVGALATGLFATAAVQASCSGAFYGNPAQFMDSVKSSYGNYYLVRWRNSSYILGS